MAKPEETYQCQSSNCGYIYNPDKGCKRGGVAKGTCWTDVPEDYKCKICGAGKKSFRPLAGPGSVAEDGV